MAQKWGDITERAGTLPWLKYDALNDARTRDEHRVLDGVTLPVSDPFWNQWLPPNGWNCRCTVRQLAQAERVEAPALPTEQEAPLYLRHNPGISQEIFGQEHGYFRNAPAKSVLRNFVADVQISDLVYLNGAERVTMHPMHAGTDRQQRLNIETAKKLTVGGRTVELLPYRNVQDVKNLTASTDGAATHIVHSSRRNRNAVSNGLKAANRKGAELLVIEFDYWSKADAIGGLLIGLQDGRNKSVRFVEVIIRSKVYRIDRDGLTKAGLETLLPA